MTKADEFKEWFEQRLGHSYQLRLAYDAVLELESGLEKIASPPFNQGFVQRLNNEYIEAFKYCNESRTFNLALTCEQVGWLLSAIESANK